MKSILVREALCSGCRACEVACVARHEGRFGTASARITVFKDEALGIDSPRVCRLCVDASCASACPTEALAGRADTGAILLDAEACLSCSACADACSYGVLRLHSTSGLPLFCDLCDGEPACVARCVTGALVYGDPDDDASMNPASRDGGDQPAGRQAGHRA